MAKKERKNTICPAGNWPASLMNDCMPTNTAIDATFNAIAVSGRDSEVFRRRHCAVASWIADQMRNGVVGISIWVMP